MKIRDRAVRDFGRLLFSCGGVRVRVTRTWGGDGSGGFLRCK